LLDICSNERSGVVRDKEGSLAAWGAFNPALSFEPVQLVIHTRMSKMASFGDLALGWVQAMLLVVSQNELVNLVGCAVQVSHN
jgi:hypothetical protein